VHHSRLRSVVERARRVVTRRTPFRCHSCDWRGWRRDDAEVIGDGPRPVHRDLTDAELDRLEPGDSVKPRAD
jgi:hypothetical protein